MKKIYLIVFLMQSLFAGAQHYPQNFRIDYLNGDSVNNAKAFKRWPVPLYMNMRYTLADTVGNPRTDPKANNYTAQYSTIIFDTIWDYWTKTFYSFPTQAVSAVYLDTIWAQFAYHNTSGLNDTCIFETVRLNAKGFPSGTVSGRDTVIFNASGPLKYNVLDSVQLIGILMPYGGLWLPFNTGYRWNFGINVKVFGSKLDTLGLWYYSPIFNCSSFSICNGYTAMGLPDGRAPAVNSLVTGFNWYNDTNNGGTSTSVTWPLDPSSAQAGTCSTNAGNWYDQVLPGCSGDTGYFPIQDIAVFASINYWWDGVPEVRGESFNISQNYPNPFKETTEISYNMLKSANVDFAVSDIAGRVLMDNKYSNVGAGKHSILLSAKDFTPGIYFYTFNVNGVKVTKRMVVNW